MKSRIRWPRVLSAALFSELGVIALLLAIGAVYSLWISPGRSAAEYQEFSARLGYYVAPAASGVAVFVSVLWLARRLTANFVMNGVLVGVVAVLLTAGFLFTAKPGDRFMYVVSFAVRIVAGYLGGLTAQALQSRKQLSATTVARATR